MRGDLSSYLMMTMMMMISAKDQMIRIYGRTDSSLLFRFIKISKIAGLGRHMLSLGIVGVWNVILADQKMEGWVGILLT